MPRTSFATLRCSRSRGRGIARRLRRGFEANWFAPGERGLDDVRVEGRGDGALLASSSLGKGGGAAFCPYREVLAHDPKTQHLDQDNEAFPT